MSPTTLIPEAPVTGPSLDDELKFSRRASRRYGLFAPQLLKAALKQSFVMLRPDVQWKNPVMFVVEIGTVLSIIFTISTLFAGGGQLAYLIQLDVWLALTVLFANFATALAEARGKAQADTLRKTRRETPAYRLRKSGEIETTVSTALEAGDRVVVEAGQVIPGDGEIVEGWRRLTNRPLRANQRPSFARQVAITRVSPAGRAFCPTALSSRSPPVRANRFSIG